MPKIAYAGQKFQRKSLQVIARAEEICQRYDRMGLQLSLRQLYYQFVKNAWLPNTEQSYKRLGGLINDARLAGLIDWLHIEDRGRERVAYDSLRDDDASQLIAGVADQFMISRWADQQYRPEVWIEKDALSGVIEPVCGSLWVPHFACKGYVSQSAMWRAGRRLKRYAQDGFTPIVIHLGDHDPSGIDMTRDIEDRLRMFTYPQHVEVRRIALTMAQIEEVDPPPNPAKLTDSRAEEYIATYGNESWELDALDPEYIYRIIKEEIDPLIDQNLWAEAEARENEEKTAIREVTDRWDDLKERWSDVEALLDA